MSTRSPYIAFPPLAQNSAPWADEGAETPCTNVSLPLFLLPHPLCFVPVLQGGKVPWSCGLQTCLIWLHPCSPSPLPPSPPPSVACVNRSVFLGITVSLLVSQYLLRKEKSADAARTAFGAGGDNDVEVSRSRPPPSPCLFCCCCCCCSSSSWCSLLHFS